VDMLRLGQAHIVANPENNVQGENTACKDRVG
jgi:hypothetical protein